jgi:hypothetical protein
MARILSPEAVGTLRALSELGKIRHFDAVAMELAVLGLAKFNRDHLAVTRKGRLLARIVDGRRLGIRARQRAETNGHHNATGLAAGRPQSGHHRD